MKRIDDSTLVRLGVRAHDIGCYAASELARRVAAEGLSCVQLALPKAIPGVDFSNGFIPADLPARVRESFEQNNVRIEVLGCYINPIHPDPATRESLHDLFRDHLRKASEFGCGLVALESGSVNSDYSPHPDNSGSDAFSDLVESLGALVAEAENCGTTIGIEGVTSHVISTPQRMRQLLDAIPSKSLKVVFDPVNLLSLENHGVQDQIIQQSIDLFGDRIEVIHAKDFSVVNDQLITVPPGQGLLNFDSLLSWASSRKSSIAVLLEEVGVNQIPAAVKFINSRLSQLSS